VVLEAIKNNCTAIHFANKKYKNDKDVITQSIRYHGVESFIESYSYTELKELSKNKELILEASKISGVFYEHLICALNEYKERVLDCIKNEGIEGLEDNCTYDQLNEIFSTKELILEPIKIDASILKNVSEELKNDKEVVLYAVKQDGMALQYASKELKNDKEIVLAAIKNDANAINYIGKNLKKELLEDKKC